ncbi:hypothetical protein BO94DRAFT_531505 [Aspergillus sclerotioniger CBS 115572]|uniref:Uncharacterized protein n=1 Tax=Aspergillus sclerotioniger CBS 115572 TaxID=1450535 RepID=A0A317X7F4_9EURO|nr:hypothetical protein BO94DRAFT_531505 [Aspergillus sclerotioniger CBS 115572]PWY94546.1 hypothetical protein BO94DRAFT_531505 [Aspergillus sclerotioniger CBS 115572]
MSESSSANTSCESKILSGHATQLLEQTRQDFAENLRSATPPSQSPALYLRLEPNNALVAEIEKQFKKKSHHCYVAVFFRGEFTVGEMYDTIIIPLEKIGNAHARSKDTSSGSTLDWSGLKYLQIKDRFIFIVDGGHLSSVVVAFERNLDKKTI